MISLIPFKKYTLVIVFLLISLIVSVNSRRPNFITIEQMMFDNLPKSPSSVIQLILDTKFKQIDVPKSFAMNHPIYFSIKNRTKFKVEPHIVINNKDWSSDSAILNAIFPTQISVSPELKAIKIMDYINDNNYHAVPTSVKWNHFKSPYIFFNQIGYGICSDFAISMTVLAKLAGLTSRIVSINDHTVSEIFYDNAWHMFDADGGCYYRLKTGQIADTETILSKPEILNDSTCYVEPFYRKQKPRYSDTKDFIREIPDEKSDTPRSMLFALNPQEEIRYYYSWANTYLYKGSTAYSSSSGNPYHSVNNLPEIYTNGVLISNITLNDIDNKNIFLPYPIVNVTIYAKNLCLYAKNISVSLGNTGKWKKLSQYCYNDTMNLNNMFLLKATDNIQYNIYSFKYTASILEKMLSSHINATVFTVFQISPKSIPMLKTGKNTIENRSGNSRLESIQLEFSFL